MSWECPNEHQGRCARVGGAYCRPGMKGCVLAGRIGFPEGEPPEPVWPSDVPPPET
nr:hypothetical protein [uncultured Holophaga sp.]